MKIINRKQFLSLPENTLYAEYEPCFFGPLTIKMQTLEPNDFIEQTIADSIQCNNEGEFEEKLRFSEENGESVKMDFDDCMRNGCFDSDDKLYAVYERGDVEALIERLILCL